MRMNSRRSVVRGLLSITVIIGVIGVGPIEEAHAAPLVSVIPGAADYAEAMVLDEPRGHLFISSHQDDRVFVTDLDGKLVKSIGVAEPRKMAIQPNGLIVWVVSKSNDEIVGIDTRSLTVIERVATPGTPRHIAAANDRVVYTLDSPELHWFSTTNPGDADSMPVPMQEGLVAISPQDSNRVVLDHAYTDGVTTHVYDLAAKSELNAIFRDGYARDLAMHPDGTSMAVVTEGVILSYSVPGFGPSTIYYLISGDAAVWNARGTHLASIDRSRIYMFERGSDHWVTRILVEADNALDVAVSKDASTVWVMGSNPGEGLTVERHDARERGSIEGRLTAADGLPLEFGLVDLYSAETLQFVDADQIDSQGDYSFEELEPAPYYVVFANTDRTYDIGYFPQLFDAAPYYRLDMATPVIVSPGKTTTRVNGVLTAFYDDMFDTPFTDDIAWMQETALTTGCGSGRYCPDDNVTRGQMAAFLVRALRLTAVDPSIDFRDDNGSVFEADIERLATAGITTGCGAGIFCPEETVTRGQMAAFLVRAMGYTERGSVEFDDDDSSVFEEDIERLAAAGVTSGCGDRIFCPGDNVTRGQMAAFLHRALGGGVLYPGAVDQSHPPLPGTPLRGARMD